ncbi:MAG: 3-dehydroquinate synthase [Terriglobales bacterium]
MRLEIPVNVAPAYTAVVSPGGLALAGELVRRWLPPSALAVVVTSPRIRGYWGEALEAGLRAADLRYTFLVLPDGERSKNLAELARLAEAMVAAGADRDSLVIAFGGGVVGDVAGLLASLYMRGVALVQVPTTLLAMVDSSLGGKTGVNLGAGKNLVGTFHHPRAILADPQVLTTLPPRQFRSGLAEAIKYGIIGAPKLFDFLETHAASLQKLESEPLAQLIAACLEQKAAVVAADERESDRRRILNFGHTLGHALESATGYERYLHGEAVAWGMLAATCLAVHTGRLAEPEAARIRAAILHLCGPLPPLREPAAEVLRHAASDKKSRAGQLHFILPTTIGRVEIAAGIPNTAILAALEQTAAMQPPAETQPENPAATPH